MEVVCTSCDGVIEILNADADEIDLDVVQCDRCRREWCEFCGDWEILECNHCGTPVMTQASRFPDGYTCRDCQRALEEHSCTP